MIDKKREQLQKKMREFHLSKHFREIREELLKIRSDPKMSIEQESSLSTEVSRCLREMSKLVQVKHYSQCSPFLEFLFQKIHEYGRMSYFILTNSRHFCLALQLGIKNALDYPKQKCYSSFAQNNYQMMYLSEMLRCLSLMTYYEFQQDDFEKVLNSFWDIIREDLSKLDPRENYQIFQLTLRIIAKMLQTQTQFIFKKLKGIGLGSRLTHIATTKAESLSPNCQILLVSIIQMYLQQQSMILQGKQVCKISEIHIVGIQNNQKQIMMAFCLSMLKGRKEKTYMSCINSLIIIFKKYEYLGTTIEFGVIQGVFLELLQSNNRKLRVKVYQLLDSIIYCEDRDSIAQILQNMTLVNVMHQILIQQLKIKDQSTKTIVEFTGIIMCNLALVRKRQIKNQYSLHPIWDLIYQNIYDGSPLLSLVATFEYYFEMANKKIINFNIVENYLTAVSTLEFKYLDIKIVEDIKRTIRRLYSNCQDFWPENLEERLISTIRRNNLLYIIDEMIPEEFNDDPPV